MTMAERAKRHGLYVATWTPGDGLRRYRFFDRPSDYDEGHEIFTALGRKEALAFLFGVAVGRTLKREV